MSGAFRVTLAFILVTLSSCSGPAPNNPTDVEVEVAEEVPRPRWVALAAEGHRTCAERDDGARYCWGDWVGRSRRVDAWIEAPSVPYPCLFDEPGRIRCPMTDSPTELGKVVGQDEGSPWIATVHTPPRACGINEAGWVYCFNSSGDGQAGFLHMMEGISPTGRSEYELEMRGVFHVDGGSHVATGQNHVCVLLRDGSIQCAGQRDRGQLGDVEEVSQELALREEPTLVGVTGMDISGQMTCAASQGRLFCWGGMAHEEGGLPNLVEGSEGAVDVALGNSLGCIIDRGRQLRCFSFDSDGFSDLESVEGVASVQAMVSDDSGVCVRDDQGRGHCLWSAREDQAEPILDGTEEMAMGRGYICGRRGERWICNSHDAIGRELGQWSERVGMCAREGESLVCVATSGMPDSYPGGFQYSGVPIETPPIATLLTAGSWLCVETRDGRTLCATDALEREGEDLLWNPTPVFRPLVGASGVQRLRSGYVHGCALLESGALHCFGRGAEGQLGLEMPETFRTEPFQVPVPSEGWNDTTAVPPAPPDDSDEYAEDGSQAIASGLPYRWDRQTRPARPRLHAVVEVGEVSVRTNGTGARDEVTSDWSSATRALARHHRADLRGCYQSELDLRPDLEGGVDIRVLVDDAGGVIQTVVPSSTLRNQPTEACLSRSLRSWQFPSPPGEGVVVLDVHFTLHSRN